MKAFLLALKSIPELSVRRLRLRPEAPARGHPCPRPLADGNVRPPSPSIRAWTGVLSASILASASLVAAAPDRPHVLLIYADDLGSIDLNCYGSHDLATPHLDALAKRGVRFTQFYSAAPVCSPSRAAVLTGRYPQRAGVPGNVSSMKGNPGMPTDEVTLAEMLKAGGYATAHIGKWHLGYTPQTMPNAQGFDYSFGHMGGCIDNYSHFFYWAGPNRHDLHRNGDEVFHDGEYFPDLMVREIEYFMRHHRDTPFFVYWALNVPHYPYQGSEKWLRRYAHLPYPRNLYAAFVSTMDEKIGEVLSALKELGLEEKTLVVFQSDNGHSKEERAHFGGGSAGPYRGEKFSLFEGGIRLPSIISWPGHLPQNETRDQMATACDWLPTLAALTGVSLPQNHLDGRNIVDLVRSGAAPSPHQVFHWESGGGRNARQWAVREGDWKLVVNGRGATDSDREFLSNLANDVGERENLAARHPALVERLKTLHTEWASSVTQ